MPKKSTQSRTTEIRKGDTLLHHLTRPTSHLLGKLVRLAYLTPEIRPDLLPLIKQAREKYRGISVGFQFKTDKKSTFWYRHERIHKATPTDLVGVYVVAVKEPEGTRITARRPLVIEWGGRKGEGSWVETLPSMFEGKRKINLTKAILRSRHDAVVTLRNGRPYQIILLDVPLTSEGVDVDTIRREDAEDKRERWFSDTAYFDTDYEAETYFNSDFAGEDLYDLKEALSQKETEETDYSYQIRHLGVEVEVSKEELNDALTDLSSTKALYVEAETEFSASEEGDADYLDLEDKLDERQSDMEDAQGEVDRVREDIEDHKGSISWTEEQREGAETSSADLQEEIDRRGFSDAAELVQEKIEEALGPSATVEDLMSVCGLDGFPSDSHYDVRLVIEGDELHIYFEGDYLDDVAHRSIKYDYTSEKYYVYNELLRLTPDAPPGLGTRILYSQILKGQEVGFSSVQCTAAQGGPYNGYYSWARMGYNARLAHKPHRDPTLGDEVRSIANMEVVKELVERGVLPGYALATKFEELTMHDMLSMPGGRKWWREYGKTWSATFDLTPTPDGGPSDCVQILESYVREKEKTRGPVDEWHLRESADREMFGAEPSLSGGAEEIRLDEEDHRILDQIWSRFLRRKIRERK